MLQQQCLERKKPNGYKNFKLFFVMAPMKKKDAEEHQRDSDRPIGISFLPFKRNRTTCFKIKDSDF